ncbi:hypothetical protein C6B38_05705 [Spiroplasma sp. ChiS]|nr:hypothetical protein C6B38_05705 [Spiroplasma sp. ChiS]
MIDLIASLQYNKKSTPFKVDLLHFNYKMHNANNSLYEPKKGSMPVIDYHTTGISKALKEITAVR